MKFTENMPSRIELIPDFVDSIVEKLFLLSLDGEAIFDIKLCLQEAVINAVIHGNKLKKDLSVDVTVRRKSNQLIVEVSDQGEGFDSAAIQDPTTDENISKLDGRGIFIIRHLTNKVQFNNKGSTIKMTKVLKRERRGKMDSKIEKMDDVTIIALSGEINITNSMGVSDVLKKLIDDNVKKMLIDFYRVTFIDSSGLAVLIANVKEIQAIGGKMGLCNVNKKIKGIFDITKMHKLINMYDTREQALKEF